MTVMMALFAAAGAASSASAESLIADCDRLAAQPEDAERVRPGVPFDAIDVEAALDACERAVAAKPEVARYRFQYARVLHRDQRLSEALRQYRLAANGGYAAAQYALGLIFLKRPVLPRHEAKAARWFRRAAESGHAGAQYLLGLRSLAGEGVDRDEEQGLRWLEAAATQGLARAQYLLGVLHERGTVAGEDRDEAAKWYRLAAAQGHGRARYALRRLEPGESQAPGPVASAAAPQGSSDDPSAAGSGPGEAAPQPGVPVPVKPLTEVSPSTGSAASVLKPGPASASEQESRGGAGADDDAAQALQAGLEAYRAGDYGAAFAAWYPFAERGIRRAQFYIGGLFMEGRGTYADKVQAYYWLKRAAGKGYPPSQPLLDRLVTQMSPAEIERGERLVTAHQQ